MMLSNEMMDEIAHAAKLLRAGKLVAFPTETVYGLGADATNEDAVRAIFTVKGRPANNPLIVHVSNFEELLCCVDLSQAQHPRVLKDRLTALKRFWPGPLSVVVPRSSSITPMVSAGGNTLAIRIPNHPIALELLRACGLPIAAPSANRSNYISPTTAQHVRDGLGDSLSHILDGGSCSIGLESTVISLIDETPTILRPGAITASDLSKALGCQVNETPVEIKTKTDQLLSPGLLAKHYSPSTPVILLSAISSSSSLPERIGAILFSRDTNLPFAPTMTKVISDNGDLAQVASNLFAALHDLDNSNIDLIVVDTCEPIGLGAAIMDRLLRASA